MADYYPLLARAVAALSDSTPESRAAIYARARNALLGQLRSLDPPVPEADVERESRALQDAIARLEIEFAPPFASDPAVEDAQPIAPEPGPGEERPGQMGGPEPERQEQGRTIPGPMTPTPTPTEQGERPSLLFKVRRDAPRPSPETPESAAGLLATSAKQPRWPRGRDALAPKPAAPGEAGPGGIFPREPVSNDIPPEPDASEREKSPSAPGAFAPGEAPLRSGADEAEPIEPGLEGAGREPPEVSPEGSAADAAERSRPEAQRPVAPQPPQDSPAPKRGWIVAAIVAVVVALVAIAAIKLKDHREDLIARSLAPAPAIESGSSGKIADRIGAGDASPEGQSPAEPSDADAGGAESSVPPFVAPRAALLVRAPQDNAEVKTYQGTVVWKVDNVSSGPGAPLSTAVRAEIDIPEQKVEAVMTLQKNDDATLPASHTMKLQFVLPRGSEWRGVQQIKVPQMRREGASTGESLKGVPVPIVENSFLVGLNGGASEAANLDLLRSREWLDIPILLGNGFIAKLTFEKGKTGQRAIDDAIAAWRAQ
ncbi:hypothetical protein [Methylocapsa palsarum]|uniref:Uncharacterized protein n=1 Tax=Methylocapsa palsarum TaxID=1612308 RepID=A0A1I3XCA4_9HYPH|nr:hypothetical protein [Methylocapsa palsarum]SFK17124.1 hypothetical protein SAMN05444581_10322 [Methylocapsa palsarum]